MSLEPKMNALLHYRIISSGLFQPILQLSLVKKAGNTVTGTAELIIKESGREFRQHYTIRGNYHPVSENRPVQLQIWGHDAQHEDADHGLLLEMEMNEDWATGIAQYQCPGKCNKTIRKATVSSILFANTQMRSSSVNLMQQRTIESTKNCLNTD